MTDNIVIGGKTEMQRYLAYVILMIFGVMLFGISCSREFDVTLIVTQHLSDNAEPKKVEIFVNDKKIGEIYGNNSEVFYISGNKEGDRIKVRYSKDGYVPNDEPFFIVSKQKNVFKHRVSFTPKNRRKINAEFISEPKIKGIRIFIGDEQVGQTNANGTFVYEKLLEQAEERILKFRLEKEGLTFRTNPDNLEINSQEVLGKIFVITTYIDKPVTFNLQVNDYLSSKPLPGVQIKFSDGGTATTNGNGLLSYNIQERRCLSRIEYRIVQPDNVVVVEGYQPVVLNSEISGKILSNSLKCRIDYVFKICVQNLAGDPLQDAEISVSPSIPGARKIPKTDEKGNVVIPISTLNQIYKLSVSKSYYQTMDLQEKPSSFITDLGIIRLRGLTGTVIVVDSLTNKPINEVNIYRDGNKIAQTNNSGRANFGINLHTPMILKFEVPESEEYPEISKEIKFTKPSDIITVKMRPRPFIFYFSIQNQNGVPIRGANISHPNVSVRSDSRGIARIELFAVGNTETFTITSGLQSQNFRQSINSTIRNYRIPPIIFSNIISVTLRSTPPNANIELFDNTNTSLARGDEPLVVQVIPGHYRVVASLGNARVEKTVELSTPDQIETIDVQDPIDLIIQKFRNKNWNEVVRIYENEKNRITPSNNDYCGALDCVFKSYAQLRRMEDAVQVAELRISDRCIGNDPIFLKNLGKINYDIGNWEKSADYYEKALSYIAYIPSNSIINFQAECLYFQASAKLEYITNNRSMTPAAKCGPLKATRDIFDEYEKVQRDNSLNPLSGARALRDRIEQEIKNVPCN